MIIAMDGLPRSGRTTHSLLLAEALRNDGHEVVVVGFPSATPLGHLLKGETISAAFRTILSGLDREMLYQQLIIPARSMGKIVICDAWLLSGMALELSATPNGTFADFNLDLPYPDLTFVMERTYNLTIQDLPTNPDKLTQQIVSVAGFTRCHSSLREMVGVWAKSGKYRHITYIDSGFHLTYNQSLIRDTARQQLIDYQSRHPEWRQQW